MKNLIMKIAEIRMLDGYTGVFGIILFYNILALYHSTVVVFHLSLRVWKQNIFSIDLNYHPRNKLNAEGSFYPPFTFSLSLWGKYLINTGEQAAQLIKESVDRMIADIKRRETEEKWLIEKAKELGL